MLFGMEPNYDWSLLGLRSGYTEMLKGGNRNIPSEQMLIRASEPGFIVPFVDALICDNNNCWIMTVC